MNKWISVEDKLPNFYTQVFLYSSLDDSIYIGYPSEEDGVFSGFKNDSNDNYYLKNVTHWQIIQFPTNPK